MREPWLIRNKETQRSTNIRTFDGLEFRFPSVRWVWLT